MSNLFEQIARGQSEWLAQGVLKHALMTSPAARKLIHDAAAKPWPLPDSPPTTIEEVPTELAQHADLLAEWTQDKTLFLELTFGVGLTRAQQKASNIDLFIVSSRGAEEISEQRYVTLLALANAIEDEAQATDWETTAKLLRSADAAASLPWVFSKCLKISDKSTLDWDERVNINATVARAEITAFRLARGNIDCPRIEGFLRIARGFLAINGSCVRVKAREKAFTYDEHFFGYDFVWRLKGVRNSDLDWWWFGFGVDDSGRLGLFLDTCALGDINDRVFENKISWILVDDECLNAVDVAMCATRFIVDMYGQLKRRCDSAEARITCNRHTGYTEIVLQQSGSASENKQFLLSIFFEPLW